VIVEDTPENIRKIETIIRFWDRKPRQVVIEAKILTVDLTDSMEFGVNWEKILGDARIGTGGFSSAVDAAAESTSPIPSGGTGIFGNLISAAGTAHQFTLALDALQTETEVNTLSTPRLLAIHGKNARVQVGGQQGYKETTVTSTGVSTESIKFLDEGVILDMTPYVDENGNVLLNVKPSVNQVTIDSETGVPTVDSITVSTWLLAKTGETVFIAGLIQDDQTRRIQGVPCLAWLPGLGPLFGRRTRSIDKSELVVLITPHVSPADTRAIHEDAIKRSVDLEEKLGQDPPGPVQEIFGF
jgi:type II secretory pathway component GspD/PulD (secretin)